MAGRYFLWFLVGLCSTMILLSVISLPVWVLLAAALLIVLTGWWISGWRGQIAALGLGCLGGFLRIFNPEPLVIHSRFFDLLGALLHSWAENLNIVFQQIFPQPVSGFAQGIITGGQGAKFSQDFYEALRRTSTMHLIAVSGYNVSLIARYIQKFFVWCTIHRKLIWVFSLIGIWLFIAFVGVPSSAIRAGVMISLFIIAERFSRTGEAWRVLVYALAIMLLQNPQAVFDLGFQLSFLATTGIVISAWQKVNGTEGGLRPLIRETLWAQTMVFPVIAFHFGTVSLLGLMANFIILPLMPMFMVLSVVPVVFGLVHIVLGKIIAVVALPGLWLAVKTIEWFGVLPYASISVSRIGWIALILYYGVIGGIVCQRILVKKKYE